MNSYPSPDEPWWYVGIDNGTSVVVRGPIYGMEAVKLPGVSDVGTFFSEAEAERVAEETRNRLLA